MRYAYNIFVSNVKGGDYLRDEDVDGRIILY
jgi:hypothetical protein